MNCTPSIPLTKGEYSLLYMDIIDVGPDERTKDIADELCCGCSVHVTPALLAELSEFADRDDDPKECATYQRLLRKARAAIKAAEEGHNAD